jgi:cell fate regulator YaaT (PSP1 superfamily)
MNSLTSKVEKLGLDMRVVRARYSFDRAVLHVTFTAEERIDYSALVQELGAELRTRIEMNQIGVRDEAGMIGGMGPCGRKLCCCSFLHRFESINVRMAKAQRVSLNPGAISGMCGRLKCCLRYEFETYRELGRNLPHDGALVQGPDGKGQVIDKDVLRQRLKVRLEDERILDYDVNEIQVDQHSKKPRREEDEDSGAEWTESEPAGKTRTGHLRSDEP